MKTRITLIALFGILLLASSCTKKLHPLKIVKVEPKEDVLIANSSNSLVAFLELVDTSKVAPDTLPVEDTIAPSAETNRVPLKQQLKQIKKNHKTEYVASRSKRKTEKKESYWAMKHRQRREKRMAKRNGTYQKNYSTSNKDDRTILMMFFIGMLLLIGVIIAGIFIVFNAIESLF